MREYEIYLPAERNDGSPVPKSEIERIKRLLTEKFGGYTHLAQRNEGAWRMGGVTFHDEVTIVRVLDHGTAEFDMAEFKKELEGALRQESILIVSREVRVI
jgi:hypothetical protein